jgi:hypothetical protein
VRCRRRLHCSESIRLGAGGRVEIDGHPGCFPNRGGLAACKPGRADHLGRVLPSACYVCPSAHAVMTASSPVPRRARHRIGPESSFTDQCLLVSESAFASAVEGQWGSAGCAMEQVGTPFGSLLWLPLLPCLRLVAVGEE